MAKFLKSLNRSHYIVLGIGLIIIVGAIMMRGKDFEGHAFSATTLYEYPYEGFEQVQDAYNKREKNKTEEKKEGFEKGAKADDKKKEGFEEGAQNKNQQKKNGKKEGFESMPESTLMKVNGLSGLYGSPDAEVHLAVPGFSMAGADGSKCKSYGYTNAKGNVCFTPEEQRLLDTRGGNYSPNTLGGNT